MVNVSQHSQGNTFTRVTFIVTAGNLKLISLFKKRFRHCSLPDSYLKFLTATFLMGIVTRKSIVIRKRDLVSFTTRVPDTSDTSTTRATQMQHECDTSNTSATQVRHECYTNDTSATRVLHERHKWDTREKF